MPLGESATLVGTLVHSVLERLPHKREIDTQVIEGAVRDAFKGLAGSNTGPEMRGLDTDIVARHVRAFVESDLWDEFGDGSVTARSIFCSVGRLVLRPRSARPSSRASSTACCCPPQVNGPSSTTRRAPAVA